MNRLADETSPYLRQHADNPVDWYPWGPDAFAAARLRDVPILLSVGYSACHWCHVMAHESFEDPATAAVMNAGFVNIKVDREERPDVDAVYMEAVQAVTGSGGWPMTVFLLPDGRPVPRAAPTFPATGSWSCSARSAGPGASAGRSSTTPPPSWPRPSGPGPPCPVAGWADERRRADAGQVPGPPGRGRRHPARPLRPRVGRLRPGPQVPAADHAGAAAAGRVPDGPDRRGRGLTTTLDAMAAGGIYDHLGGGFARYSTDRRWLVPHFEKMLYDNALLARVYLHAWQLTGADRYRQVVERDARVPAAPARAPAARGSGLGRGRRQRGRGRPLLRVGRGRGPRGRRPSRRRLVRGHRGGNWEGRNILFRPARRAAGPATRGGGGPAGPLGPPRRRVRPGLDDKVLTEWNAMAVAALAEAGGAFAADAG